MGRNTWHSDSSHRSTLRASAFDRTIRVRYGQGKENLLLLLKVSCFMAHGDRDFKDCGPRGRHYDPILDPLGSELETWDTVVEDVWLLLMINDYLTQYTES